MAKKGYPQLSMKKERLKGEQKFSSKPKMAKKGHPQLSMKKLPRKKRESKFGC